MNKTIVYAFAWISTAVAVSVAVYITKSAMPLFAMTIPAFIMDSDSK